MEVAIGRLWVLVSEGRNLAVKDLTGTSDPYCVLTIEGQSQRQEHKTEVIDRNLNPTWNEEFTFDIYSNKASLQVQMWDEDLLSKDDFMGMVTVPIFPDLDDEEPVEKWITLQPRKSKDKVKGDIKLKFQFISTFGMDDYLISQYMKFGQYLTRELNTVINLCDATTERKDDICRILVSLFHQHASSNTLIQSFCEREVRATLGESTLFRTDSMGTKLTTALCRVTGLSYLKHTLARPVAALITNAPNMEIDPSRLKSKHDGPKNCETLKNVTQLFVDSVLDSLDQVPIILRETGYIISEEVVKKFPTSGRVSMAGFFFLRFVCPSFLNPKKFELIDEASMTDQVQRAFILVAKIMQNLANNVQFGGKEAYMIPLNDLIVSNQSRVNSFLEKLPIKPKGTIEFSPVPQEVEKSVTKTISHDLKILHRHMISPTVADKLAKSMNINVKTAGYDVSKLLDILPRPANFQDLTSHIHNFNLYMGEYIKGEVVSPDPESPFCSLNEEASFNEGSQTRATLKINEIAIEEKETEQNEHRVVNLNTPAEEIISHQGNEQQLVQGATEDLDELLRQLESEGETLAIIETEQKTPNQADVEVETSATVEKETEAKNESISPSVETNDRAIPESPKPEEPEGDPRLEESFYSQLPEPPINTDICLTCNENVSEHESYASACDRKWHINHFQCAYCQADLTSVPYAEKYKRPFCEHHYNEIFGVKCCSCKRPITGQCLQLSGQSYHLECLRCGFCQSRLDTNKIYQKSGTMICEGCHLSSAVRCGYCNEVIIGKHLNALNRAWHVEHFICTVCCKPIPLGKGYRQHNGQPMCEGCTPSS